MDNQTINGKRRARKLALQALYQWLMAGGAPYEIEAQFRATNDMSKIDGEYLNRLLHGVLKSRDAIEKALMPFLDRPLASLNPIELSVLRLSAYELLYCPELPYRVVLDEAVSLAKSFGSQDGHRYVNGVLNNLARKVRQNELNLRHE